MKQKRNHGGTCHHVAWFEFTTSGHFIRAHSNHIDGFTKIWRENIPQAIGFIASVNFMTFLQSILFNSCNISLYFQKAWGFIASMIREIEIFMDKFNFTKRFVYDKLVVVSCFCYSSGVWCSNNRITWILMNIFN